MNTQKIRLILHVGTPKTGTSSLQHFLFVNYDALKASGVLYPKSVLGPPNDPKHQPVFSSLYAGNEAAFVFCIRNISAEAGDGCRTIVLSSEGFYHLMQEYSERSWDMIRRLAGFFRLQVVVYLRPQAEYIESVYRQYLKNPRGINREFGSSLTITELLAVPRIRQNLDYYGSLTKWSAAVGEQNIIVRKYSMNVVDDFLSVLDVNPAGLVKPPARNPSLTRELAELLRQANAYLEDEKRDRLIRNMEKYAELRKRHGEDMPFLPPAARTALASHFKPANDLVAQKWLGRPELFSAPETSSSGPWEPLRADRASLLSLFGEIMAA